MPPDNRSAMRAEQVHIVAEVRLASQEHTIYWSLIRAVADRLELSDGRVDAAVRLAVLSGQLDVETLSNRK
jgi:hypothetical protein